jgi:cation:H+ antiporter
MLVAGLILLGLLLLIIGGELLVRGAVALAAACQISPLVIGLTVVAFGTSAPELGVSLRAAFVGSADVALGNVVGSNIVNVLMVLGASAFIAPLIVSSKLIRVDVPLMIAASLLMWAMSLDGLIGRWEGLFLVSCLLGYVWLSVRASRRESAEVTEEFTEFASSRMGLGGTLRQVGLIVVGLILLTFGARWLVDGAVTIATSLGVSELVIGLTIVAIGTSLPELVTSIVASIRGQRDIAVGNVVGSNLFNILCVLGLTSAVSPNGVAVSQQALSFDIPVMVAVAVICLPIFFLGSVIRRYEGALLVSYFVMYLLLLVVASTYPEQTGWYQRVVLYVVLPLTVLTLAFSMMHSIRDRRRQRHAGDA